MFQKYICALCSPKEQGKIEITRPFLLFLNNNDRLKQLESQSGAVILAEEVKEKNSGISLNN